MQRVAVVIVGAGHAGLAMSKCLTDRSIDHVVLERGSVANSWKTERWRSLRLLTPNWMRRLPGFDYRGADPEGYSSLSETIQFIEAYGTNIAAPVLTHTTVTSVSRIDAGYRIESDRGPWECRAVVAASGACNIAKLPTFAESVPSSICTLTAMQYREPSQLPPGAVLVVGASASGAQIAEEVHRSGRPVTLSVGEHLRGPRVYRGRDIHWWMDAVGVFDETYDQLENLARARTLASMQLVGSTPRRDLDLNALTAMGVELVGRLAGIDAGAAQFSGSLHNMCTLSDLKSNRLLDRIDEWVLANDLAGDLPPPHRFEATRVPARSPYQLDLRGGAFRTILWATGYRPDHSWIEVPVFDPRGRIRHEGGVVPVPGLYLIGMPLLRSRRSTFIDGVNADARFLSAHLASTLAGS